MEITRRSALGGIAALGTAWMTGMGGSAMAADAIGIESPTPPAPGRHALRPLPFAPGKLRGLSERLLVSHHENNYAGAVKNLNEVEEHIARTTKDTPGFVIAGLKERELTFSNSVTLHELYFANLGGDGKAKGAIARSISDAFDGFGRFEERFRATGMSLAGGSGWTVLDYCFSTDALRIHWSGGHSQSAASATPLLVLDMYEHAFALDYGAAAAKYVDAFFENVQWDEVSRRLERACAAARAMKA